MDEYTVEQIDRLITAVGEYEDSDQTDTGLALTIVRCYEHVANAQRALAVRAVVADKTCDETWPRNQEFKDIELFVTHASFAKYTAILPRLMCMVKPKRVAD